MPIYEYKCSTCSNVFELRRGFGDDPNAACPDCEGQAERIFSAVPILFKGPGFYVTDYKNNTLADMNSGSSEATPAKTKGEAVTAT